MFTTKKQVDQHVKTSLAKLRSENEKRLRGLVIAKMYFKIGEYASAQHYVSGYLSSNEAAPQAHRLLGDCYCKLKQPEKALPCYQRSFQLDNKQTDLLIDACNLILAEDLNSLKSNAKFWCEAAANSRIQHESVFNLKLKMLAGDENKDTKQVEEMIVKEINNRPSEVSPRLQLVNYYISKSRPEDAFKYICDIMTRTPGQFLNSLEWYAAVHKALKLYRQSTDVVLSKHWDYWVLGLTAVDRQLSMALAQDHNLSSQQAAHLSHCQSLLFELDQMLYTAANISFPVRAELSAQLISHFQGQFLLHVASYLFKRERTLNSNQWWTTVNSALPLLFSAFRVGIASTEDSWLKQASESTRELVRLWQRQGAFRCTQAGRTLLACVQSEDRKHRNVAPFKSAEELTDAARKQCASRNWTTTLFRGLFTNDEYVSKTGTSFMATSNLLAEPTFELPTVLRIQMYERIAEALQSDSLPQLIYLYLHNDKLSECDFNVFAGLELTTSNIFNCGAATLNKLDIETFLVATVMQTKSRLESESQSVGHDGPRPWTMPYANMARLLCTEEQLRWWQAAYTSTQGVGGTDGETWNIREVLQDGIEAVRGVGTPKVDLMIALLTGDVLKQRTDNNLAIDLTTKKAYEQRVENIFQCALHLYKNQSTAAVTDKRRQLFHYHSKAATVVGTDECDALLEGAIIFLAEHHFRAGDYENCIEALNNVQLPYATYYIAEAYKKMDESNRNNRTPPRSGSYQGKVKQYLGQTQKLLASGSKKGHSLRTVVSNELKKMQYSDLNASGVSLDDDLNVSYPGAAALMNRSRQESSLVVDQVSALTALVTQLTMQNTMMQSEMTDIKKMLQQQKEEAAKATPAVEPSYTEARLRAEEQQRMATYHHSPHYDYMNGRYSVGGGGFGPMGAYQGLPGFQGTPQFPPHMRSPAGMYAQDATALAMAHAANSSFSSMFDPLTGALTVPPMAPQSLPQQTTPTGYYQPPPQMTGQQQQQQHHHQQPPPQQQQHSALTSQLQQPPIPLATSSTVEQAFTGNSILKTWNSTYNNEPVEKVAPANVVITSSDPVPMHNTVTAQKLLSVTIPPQHIKNFGQTTTMVKPHDVDQFPTVLSGSFNNHSSTLSHTATNISGDETATEEDDYYGGDYSVHDDDQPSVHEEVHATMPETVVTQVMPLVKKDVAPAASVIVPPPATAASVGFGGFGMGGAGEAAKPSPFTSFTFGATATTTAAAPEKPFSSLFGSLPPAPTANNVSSPEKPFASLFGNLPKPTPSVFGFSSTPTANNTPVKDVTTTTASPGKGTDDPDDDYVPTAQFKPVIELPSLIEVKTGEEDETVAFEHRAKLLRFDPSTKEWKERGLGNIRIMVKKDDPSQVRLLMRREQVLKLACNQRVAKDQEFKKMPNSETALSWYAQDYAENELKTELFAIRFKTSENCKAFHTAILEAQKNMVAGSGGAPAKAESAKPGTTTDQGVKKGFGDMFKKQVGSWECKACLIMNKTDVVHCVACDSPKDDTVPKKEAEPKGLDLSGVKPGQFSFGFNSKPAVVAPVAAAPVVEVPQNLTTKKETVAAPAKAAVAPVKGFGDAFKPKAGTWECQACYITNKGDVVICISCGTLKEGAEAPAAEDKPAAAPTGLNFGATAATGGGFSFGMGKSSFSFGAPATTTATAAPATPFANLFNNAATTTSGGLFGQATEPAAADDASANGPSFGLDSKPTFNFVFKPKSPGKGKSPQKMTNGAGGAGGEEENESDEENIEEENTAYFTPVIALPDKVEARTGEEDEEVLYSHRAKLFRFSDGEWKERGLGDVKVLRHRQTEKLRVVMRREQVLKICLNHVLDESVEYSVKDNKSWHFVANDFSEGVLELMQFSLRFKTPEIATEFKEAVDAALGNSTGAGDDTAATLDTTSDGTAAEGSISAEEQRLVKQLKLPDDFFNYNGAEECPGCRGCNDDAFEYTASAEVVPEERDLPLQMPTLPKPVVKAGELAKSIFGGFNQSLTTMAAESPNKSTNLFGAATMFSGSPTKPTTAPIFGGSTFGQPPPAFGGGELKASPASMFSGLNNSFGAATTTGGTATGSLFGSSTFGAAATTITGSPSIFGSALASTTLAVTSGTVAPPAEVVKAPAPTSIFGQSAFGSSATSTFGSFNFGTAAQSLTFDRLKEATPETAAATTEVTTQEAPAAAKTQSETAENLFKMDSNFSFASLAQQEPGTVFSGAKPEVSAGGFFGLSNTNDFRHFSKPTNGNGDAEDETAEDPNYDPHYEPIIALPEEIAVSTGEEEESKLFGERGCLYRYDATNKEWKERGVGEFKILHHPGKGTYRFVMRREQIFKLVLNHAISADFEFKPMNKTGKSFCWAAMNHAEQGDGQLEQLAVRFKNTDIATKFEESVKNCISNLQD